MATKQFKEMRNLTQEELASRLREQESGLFQDRIKLATGQLNDTAKLWRTRKEIARLKTLHTQLSAGVGSSKNQTGRARGKV